MRCVAWLWCGACAGRYREPDHARKPHRVTPAGIVPWEFSDLYLALSCMSCGHTSIIGHNYPREGPRCAAP